MKFRIPLVFIVILLVLVSLLLMAFQVEMPERVEEIIAGAIAFIIMLFGPKPLKGFYDLIKIPGGMWRVIATYVIACLLGFGALFAAGMITGVPTSIEQAVALGGLLMAAANAAFHWLKDLHKI